MRVKTKWNGGEVGIVDCTLGEVPILRTLQFKCPDLRIEVIFREGKKHMLIPMKDIDLHQDSLMRENANALPHVGDTLPLTPAHLDGLSGLGKRSAG